MGDMVPQDPDANPFIDNEAMKELGEKVVDVLRPIGLTIDTNDIQYQVHPEHGMVMIIPALVRPSAKEKMTEERETRDAFNEMMANNNDEKIEDEAEKIREMVDSNNFEDMLFGDAPEPESCEGTYANDRHPSGHCMLCGNNHFGGDEE